AAPRRDARGAGRRVAAPSSGGSAGPILRGTAPGREDVPVPPLPTPPEPAAPARGPAPPARRPPAGPPPAPVAGPPALRGGPRIPRGEPLGQVLVRMGALSQRDLEAAVARGRAEGRKLGELLVAEGIV